MIRIGRYDISPSEHHEEKVFIRINELDPKSCGEGGEFEAKELEALIDKFYRENF